MPTFSLGQLVATPGALDSATHADLLGLVARHASGDWGDLDAEDRRANETALRIGERLLSAYTVPSSGARVWLITERDRSATTILLPSEY
jgi:hypothetical protein